LDESLHLESPIYAKLMSIIILKMKRFYTVWGFMSPWKIWEYSKSLKPLHS